MENLTSGDDPQNSSKSQSNELEAVISSVATSAEPALLQHPGTYSIVCRGPGRAKLFKDQLEKVLNKVKEEGEFAVSGCLENAPNTTIKLKDGGNLHFPLDGEQVAKVKGFFQQSPFGKKTETIIDTSVRNSWQLSPEDFEIVNNKWGQYIDEKLIVRIGKEMKISSPIKARLYKFLLYESGSFFKPHRDSEKENGMFGTLVIQLPSEYEGGELLVTLGGETKKIDFSSSGGADQFSAYFSAFYCDVQHEVLEVKKGYRACLIYNLVSAAGDDRNTIPLAPGYGNLKTELEFVLKSWPKQQSKIIYILSHKYTEANLSFNTLKNSDKVLANLLHDLKDTCSLTMVLCLLDRHEYGQCKCCDEDGRRYGGWYPINQMHGFEEVDDIEIENDLKILWNDVITGSSTVCNKDEIRILAANETLDIDANIEVLPKLFGGPDKEDCSGPTGNEGVTLERWYHKAAIIFWPEERYLDVLAGSDCSFGLLAQKFLELVEGKSIKADEPQKVKDLVETILRKRNNSYNNSGLETVEQLVKIFEVIIQLGDLELIQKFLESFIGEISIEIIPQLEQLGGWHEIAPIIYKLMETLPEYKTAPLLFRLVQYENISLEAKTIFGNAFEILMNDKPLAKNTYHFYPYGDADLNFVHSMLGGHEYFNSSRLVDFIKSKSKANKDYLLRSSAPALVKFISERVLLKNMPISITFLRDLHNLAEYFKIEIDLVSYDDIKVWKMMNVNLGACNCIDCTELLRFLNGNNETYRFKVVQKRCKHIQQTVTKIDGLKQDLIQSGRPFTLVITKINPTIEKRANTVALNIRSKLNEASVSLDQFGLLLEYQQLPQQQQGHQDGIPPPEKKVKTTEEDMAMTMTAAEGKGVSNAAVVCGQ